MSTKVFLSVSTVFFRIVPKVGLKVPRELRTWLAALKPFPAQSVETFGFSSSWLRRPLQRQACFFQDHFVAKAGGFEQFNNTW